jgi:hypothetical protein
MIAEVAFYILQEHEQIALDYLTFVASETTGVVAVKVSRTVGSRLLFELSTLLGSISSLT